ncbi:FAD/FMN-containing dehydrogenase [Prauserella shujinwangii]|uniref:FAD/FMN-containing dehydrogenase n=1 Tax=Prauserella shujinwangii TaxID=1453103 RepID=A0A2T0LVY9_9PSEU|nr:FAD-binding protein [Prauserella shujinwangii]PRX48194.1 FAD/FMN-containing dehydrogenase [Prauserella shujinwangii]
MPDPFTLADLPALTGRAHADDASLAAAAQDWGRVVQARPAAVVRPGRPEDVAAVVRFAAERGVPVAARGAGHSPFGQGQAEGGIVLDMRSLSRVHAGTGEALLVDAGATWREVLAASLPRGLTPPVLTDYLDLTVGGTLAVGGLGGASHHHGAQTDTVAGLQVVTGTGELRHCSADEDPDLFDAVRAGLGQCGVVTRAAIRLRPARQRARRWRLYYDSAAAFVADQRTAVRDGRFGYLEGQAQLDDETGSWRYLLEAAVFYSLPDEPDEAALLGDLAFDAESVERDDTTYLAFLDRMAEGETILRAEGSWYHPHPWLNVLVPDDAVTELVPETLAATDGADLGDTGLVMLYPVRTGRLGTPLLRTPFGELAWLFALLRTGDPYDVEGCARMVARNREIFERVRDRGGTVYPVNMLPMSAKDWETHFGAAWPELAAAKRRFDPRGILTPGQRVFP